MSHRRLARGEPLVHFGQSRLVFETVGKHNDFPNRFWGVLVGVRGSDSVSYIYHFSEGTLVRKLPGM